MDADRALGERGMKPCPFCGEAPRLMRITGGPNGYVVACMSGNCPSRPATPSEPLKEAAIGRWNSRRGEERAPAESLQEYLQRITVKLAGEMTGEDLAFFRHILGSYVEGRSDEQLRRMIPLNMPGGRNAD